MIHVLRRAEILAVSKDDGDIEITVRSLDDGEHIETVGIPAGDVGILIEALRMIRDGRSSRVVIRPLVEKIDG